MSYILDALRKSQAERQGVTLHASADENGALALAQLRRGRWLAAMGLALLIINVLVAGFLYLRKEATQPLPTVSSRTQAEATAKDPAALVRQLPSPAVVAVAPFDNNEGVESDSGADIGAADVSRDIDMEQAYEKQRRTWSHSAPPFAQVAATDEALQENSNGDDRSQPFVEKNRAAQPLAKAEAPQESLDPARQHDNDTALPLLVESALAKDGRFANVKIDVHVYAAVPSQRFVLINMKKYREGETTDVGLALNSITPDAVIVSYEGQQYKLLPQ